MTDTEYTPIPPDDLDAMAEALKDYCKAVAQANACTSVDGVVGALEVIAVAANKAMPYFPRLLAEAREAQRLRGELFVAQLENETKTGVIAQLTARVAELEAAQGWQPIETAPKDGTIIFVEAYDHARLTGPVHSGYWSPAYEGGPYAWVEDYDYKICDPTHWMPLPQPPASDSQGEGG